MLHTPENAVPGLPRISRETLSSRLLSSPEPSSDALPLPSAALSPSLAPVSSARVVPASVSSVLALHRFRIGGARPLASAGLRSVAGGMLGLSLLVPAAARQDQGGSRYHREQDQSSGVHGPPFFEGRVCPARLPACSPASLDKVAFCPPGV